MNSTEQTEQIKAKLSWQPLLRGGTSWQTRRLKQINDQLLEVIPTGGERWLASSILMLSILALIVLLPYLFYYGQTGLAVFTLFSAPLFGLMGYAMLKSLKKMTFDLQAGTFYQNDASDAVENAIKKPKQQPFFRVSEYGQSASITTLIHGRIAEVCALQVITETIQVRNHAQLKRQFKSHELNLVMRGGKRINVIDHGNREVFDRDVKSLAAFLQKPIWREE